MKNSELKKRVMRRVYLVYVKNFVIDNGAYVTVFAIFILLVTSISIVDIANNMPKNDLIALSNFIVVAISETETAVKVMLGLFAFASVAPLVKLGLKASRRKWLFRSPALQA